LNSTSQAENIAFYCIHDHSIEKHIFDTDKAAEVNWSSNVYPRFKFLDFSVVRKSSFSTLFEDELIVISEDFLNDETVYFLHFFDVRPNLVTWRSKVRILIPYYYSLRKNAPLVDIDQESHFIFINERETGIYFISREGINEAEINIRRKVQTLQIFSNLIFITHYDYNEIPVYKISSYTDSDEKVFLQVDYLNSYIFEHDIHAFSTQNTNRAVVFTQESTIELWEVVSPYKIDYIRTLPLFIYVDNMKFYFTEGDNKLVFARYDTFLYVILISKDDPKRKKLFCFNMLKTSHDALYSVIDLDEALYDKRNGLLVESSTFQSTIYIYLFYGGSQYQLIKFEPENLLQQIGIGGELFLPITGNYLRTYPDANITLTVFPVYDDFEPTQAQPIDLFIQCKNFGFKIESKVVGNEIVYSNEKGETFMSLLDHFDGFNNTFELVYNEPENKNYLTYKFESDMIESYLLESVKSGVNAIFSFEYNERVAVFYNVGNLMQVYNIDGAIERISQDLDYSETFDG
jgi:hypothetical protein